MRYEIDTEKNTLHIHRNNPVLITNLVIYILISVGYIWYTLSQQTAIFWVSVVMYLCMPVVFLLMTYRNFFLEYFVRDNKFEVWLFKWRIKSTHTNKVKIFMNDFTGSENEPSGSSAGMFTIDIDEKEYNLVGMSEEQFLELKEFFIANNISLTAK